MGLFYFRLPKSSECIIQSVRDHLEHLVASRRRRLGRICSNIPRFEELGNAVADVCSAVYKVIPINTYDLGAKMHNFHVKI